MTTQTKITSPESSDRLQVRSEVALASRPVAPLWPARTVIAVNPLLGLLEQPFVDATKQARSEMGARGFRSLKDFRADFTEGKISRVDLKGSLLELVAGAVELRPIPTPNGEIEAIDLLVSDLLYGPEEKEPTVLDSTGARCDRLIGSNVAPTVDRIVARWLTNYTDQSGSSIHMPIDATSFHAAAKSLALHDREVLKLTGGTGRGPESLLCDSPEESINHALAELEVSEDRRVQEIKAQLLRLRGWAGWIKWRTEWADANCQDSSIDLVELVAVRLSLEAAGVSSALASGKADPSAIPATPKPQLSSLSLDSKPEARLEMALKGLGVDPSILSADARARAFATLSRLGDSDRLAVWLGAQEASYRDALLGQLSTGSAGQRTSRPPAQVVFCIDVRSEGIRRHLESVGATETLGFAGFFAVAVDYKPLGSAGSTALCPVLLSPAAQVEEVISNGSSGDRFFDKQASGSAYEHAFHSTKSGLASSFALAEAGGMLAALVSAARTFSPRLAGWLENRKLNGADVPTEMRVTPEGESTVGFTTEEQVKFAHAALTMMGLTKDFARLVVFCAHQSDNVNNPYSSALDCGACGGNGGSPNARIAAAILNRAEVRRELERAGISIPEDTHFAAASHDTAANTVTVLDKHLIPSTHIQDLRDLEADLKAAGEALAVERESSLPGSGLGASASRLPARGLDWGQIRPEWGLAGNAAFIVGSRSITEGLNLESRTFLHSYDAEIDTDGSALETILTAPLVVAHWINSQYYFSTVDPEAFGAGDKTLHNVLGNGCVVVGSGGDLKVGLPWQSVGVGDRTVHEPLRLLAVVEAPLERIEGIIGAHPILQHLIGGGWVKLIARADSNSEWHVRSLGGTWTSWVPAAEEQTNQLPKEVAQ